MQIHSSINVGPALRIWRPKAKLKLDARKIWTKPLRELFDRSRFWSCDMFDVSEVLSWDYEAEFEQLILILKLKKIETWD